MGNAPSSGEPSAPLAVASVQHPSVDESTSCRAAREVLDLVADKWSLYVVSCLGAGPQRFTEIKNSIPGISQRMLTVTLRGLERDGVVTRTVYAVMPPNVTYTLTPIGRTLLDATRPLIEWINAHLEAIEQARQQYDDRADHQRPGRSKSRSGRRREGNGR